MLIKFMIQTRQSLKSLWRTVSGGLLVLPVLAAEPTFNRDIRPILSENCFLCHGQDPAHRGGDLRLDVREEALATRDEGAAIIPGNAKDSAIIRRIHSKDPDVVMPPPDAHLAALAPEQIATLEKWIENGAVYEAHWAFVAPVKTKPPGEAEVHPVDAFVRARLKSEGLAANAEADPETLVRRLYLDLTGLPPVPEEIDAYLAGTSPDRWQRLIDQLMDSPHFAERLALPWLDAARYSDTHGFSIDDHRDMWGWRDWVIHAFQKNQPYDQFLVEQIAGDLIPAATPDQIAATGFLRNSMNTHEGGTIAEEYRVNYTLDKVDAVATTMLGLTMKCAQCHDHKYDPISQKEYFQFYAFFNTSSEPGKGATNASTPPVMEYTSPLGDGGLQGLQHRVAELEYLKLHPTAPIIEARQAWEASQKANPKSAELAPVLATPPGEREPAHWQAINAAFIAAGGPMAERMAIVLKTLDVEIKAVKSDLTRGRTTVMVMDHKPALRKTHILTRGAYDQPAEEVSPGTLAVLPPLGAAENPTRLDLARWITRPDHPLTARVAVNRMWQMIFGRGMVETAGDFGNQGSWPTHPELLDWLAVDFIENGWDLRHLMRVILTSETYRQSAAATPEQLEKDPRNEWLSRSPRSRLPAEIIRDQALAVSGLLNPAIGGPGVHPPQSDLWSEISHFGYDKPFTAQMFYPGRGPSLHRRSIYTFWKRTSPPPAMALFDAPTRETCSVVRSSTNTPLQALVLLNESQFVEAGIALGRRMIAEGGGASDERLALGFRLVTGRAPAAAEKELLARALARHQERYAKDPAAAKSLAGSAEQAAYAMLGATLLNLDESINRP
jgi:hypothetical protein